MNKIIRLSTRAAGMAAGVALATAAFAVTSDGSLGTRGDPESYDRVVTITPATKSVNVERDESVKFVVTSSGQSFVWRFDSPKLGFPLDAVAPEVLRGQHVEAYIDNVEGD